MIEAFNTCIMMIDPDPGSPCMVHLWRTRSWGGLTVQLHILFIHVFDHTYICRPQPDSLYAAPEGSALDDVILLLKKCG